MTWFSSAYAYKEYNHGGLKVSSSRPAAVPADLSFLTVDHLLAGMPGWGEDRGDEFFEFAVTASPRSAPSEVNSVFTEGVIERESSARFVFGGLIPRQPARSVRSRRSRRSTLNAFDLLSDHAEAPAFSEFDKAAARGNIFVLNTFKSGLALS